MHRLADNAFGIDASFGRNRFRERQKEHREPGKKSGNSDEEKSKDDHFLPKTNRFKKDPPLL